MAYHLRSPGPTPALSNPFKLNWAAQEIEMKKLFFILLFAGSLALVQNAAATPYQVNVGDYIYLQQYVVLRSLYKLFTG